MEILPTEDMVYARPTEKKTAGDKVAKAFGNFLEAGNNYGSIDRKKETLLEQVYCGKRNLGEKAAPLAIYLPVGTGPSVVDGYGSPYHGYCTSIIKFPLNELPDDASIKSAKLVLYKAKSIPTGEKKFMVWGNRFSLTYCFSPDRIFEYVKNWTDETPQLYFLDATNWHESNNWDAWNNWVQNFEVSKSQLKNIFHQPKTLLEADVDRSNSKYDVFDVTGIVDRKSDRQNFLTLMLSIPKKENSYQAYFSRDYYALLNKTWKAKELSKKNPSFNIKDYFSDKRPRLFVILE